MAKEFSRVPLLLFALIVVGVGGWFGGAWFTIHRTMGGPDHKESMAGMSDGSMTRGAAQDAPSKEESSTSSANEAEAGAKTHEPMMIEPAMARQLGVTTGLVESAPLKMSVQAVGIVRPDETRVSDVYLKTDGWVKDVFVDFTGKRIEKDAKLLSIYSPDFVTAQDEFVLAGQKKSIGGLAKFEASLQAAALEKLHLLDIPEDEIDRLKRTGKPSKYLTLRSPLSGTVLKKQAFPGQRVTPSDMLYMVADLSKVWIQAKVYEYELSHIELGQPAFVTIGAFPNETFEGKVVFVQPSLDESSRTTDVRIELPNDDGRIKIGMFADVRIMHDMGTGLLVDMNAVIRSGEKDVVFRVKDGMHYEPVTVKISPVKFGSRFHVLDGLAAGDEVVSSANFLIDSESRLRVSGGGAMPGMDMGSGTRGDKATSGHNH